MRFTFIFTTLITVLLFMSGCGGGSDGGISGELILPKPKTKTVSELVICDVNGTTLGGAEISFNGQVVLTDASGVAQVGTLAPGTYAISVLFLGTTYDVTVTVGDPSYLSYATAILPLDYDPDGNTADPLPGSSFTASVSGMVFDDNAQPLADAKVALKSNGTVIATVFSDANGAYTLPVYSATDINLTLETTTLTASRAGYQSITLPFMLDDGVNVNGVNFQMISLSGPIPLLYPDPKEIKYIRIKDVNGQSLNGASVTVGSASETLTADASGTVTVSPSLGTGSYSIVVTFLGTSKTVVLTVGVENYQDTATIMVPISYDSTSGTVESISDAVLGAVSGMVFNDNAEPVVGAQVSISGGIATNGTFSSTVTDANGVYHLLINVSSSIAAALQNSSIIVSSPDYITTSTTFAMTNGKNITGVNVRLSPLLQPGIVYYSENFDGDTSDWSTLQLEGVNPNNTWHLHTQDAVGVNKAYSNNNVKLAPDDSSGGETPLPYSGQHCFWYGNGVLSDDTYGNFIDEYESSFEFDGGTGNVANSGELISPTIDLSDVTGDLQLSFKTWWEIESVNPNSGGYDIMQISISTDNGASWRALARLNPLSDPASSLDRDAIPFSNRGFNAAPMWLTQEGIPLIDSLGNSVAGHLIKLKFSLDTVDNLYNGYRGWFIDDVVIMQGKGTFPVMGVSAFSAAKPATNPSR